MELKNAKEILVACVMSVLVFVVFIAIALIAANDANASERKQYRRVKVESTPCTEDEILQAIAYNGQGEEAHYQCVHGATYAIANTVWNAARNLTARPTVTITTRCAEDELLKLVSYEGDGNPNTYDQATYRCVNVEDFIRRNS